MNTVLEQAKQDMNVDGVCDVGALMDEIESLVSILNECKREHKELFDGNHVLTIENHALRQRVKDLTAEVDAAYEDRAMAYRELAELCANNLDAERYQWLMSDCDGDDQDDLIRWLNGTVASKEEIDLKIDATRMKEKTA